jgi:hypothetical protein
MDMLIKWEIISGTTLHEKSAFILLPIYLDHFGLFADAFHHAARPQLCTGHCQPRRLAYLHTFSTR